MSKLPTSRMATNETRPPLPPFTDETAWQKVGVKRKMLRGKHNESPPTAATASRHKRAAHTTCAAGACSRGGVEHKVRWFRLLASPASVTAMGPLFPLPPPMRRAPPAVACPHFPVPHASLQGRRPRGSGLHRRHRVAQPGGVHQGAGRCAGGEAGGCGMVGLGRGTSVRGDVRTCGGMVAPTRPVWQPIFTTQRIGPRGTASPAG